MEIETITKSQRETILKIEYLGKRSGVIDHQKNISDRIKNLRCRSYHRIQ